MTYKIDTYSSDPSFYVNHYDEAFEMGLSIIDQNPKSYFEIGWRLSDTGVNFGFRKPNGLGKQRHGRGATTHHFNLRYGKLLHTVKAFKISNWIDISSKNGLRDDALYYGILYKGYLHGGISINYILRHTEEGETETNNNWKIGLIEKYSIPNRWGPNINIGYTMQFFNFNRDTFRLEFMYSKGLMQRYVRDITYIMPDDTEYSARIGSRGSYFSVTLGYPILLKSKYGNPI